MSVLRLRVSLEDGLGEEKFSESIIRRVSFAAEKSGKWFFPLR